MLNAVYQLKRPRQFEAVFKRIDLDDSQIIVRPTYLSICNADQRYYQGTRNKAVLKQKLPMALIHEGIGRKRPQKNRPRSRRRNLPRVKHPLQEIPVPC